MRGKQKCRILKDIRRRIAEENDIPFVTRECGFQGECRGTCPRCESELRYLEQQLERRAALGKRISVAALCAGIAIGTAACGPVGTGTFPANNSPDDVVDDLSGAVGPDDAGMYETSAQASATAAAAGQDAGLSGTSDTGDTGDYTELSGEVGYDYNVNSADGCTTAATGATTAAAAATAATQAAASPDDKKAVTYPEVVPIDEIELMGDVPYDPDME